MFSCKYLSASFLKRSFSIRYSLNSCFNSFRLVSSASFFYPASWRRFIIESSELKWGSIFPGEILSNVYFNAWAITSNSFEITILSNFPAISVFILFTYDVIKFWILYSLFYITSTADFNFFPSSSTFFFSFLTYFFNSSICSVLALLVSSNSSTRLIDRSNSLSIISRRENWASSLSFFWVMS